MHTLALTPQGQVYSWGCNDEGALGRTGTEDKPMLIELNYRVNGISAGDSHSIFYNTIDNKAFFVGVYKVSKIFWLQTNTLIGGKLQHILWKVASF